MTAHFNTGFAAFGRDRTCVVLLNNSHTFTSEINDVMLTRLYAGLPGKIIDEARPVFREPG